MLEKPFQSHPIRSSPPHWTRWLQDATSTSLTFPTSRSYAIGALPWSVPLGHEAGWF